MEISDQIKKSDLESKESNESSCCSADDCCEICCTTDLSCC